MTVEVNIDALELVLQTGGEVRWPVFREMPMMGWESGFNWTPSDVEINTAMLPELIEHAVEMAVGDSKKIAILVSGGVDSSLLWTILKEVRPDADIMAIHTNFGVPEKMEVDYAIQMAKYLKSDLEVIDVSPLAQIPHIADSLVSMRTVSYSATAVCMAFKHAKNEGYDFALNALGLDELMAGYTIHKRFFNRIGGFYPAYLAKRGKLRKFANRVGSKRAFMLSNMFLEFQRLVKGSRVKTDEIYSMIVKSSLWDTIQNWTLRAMYDNFATLINRAALANGVIVKFPYMNAALMYYCLCLPPKEKYNKKPIRWLMRNWYKMPEEIAARGEQWDKIGWGGTPLPYFDSPDFMEQISTNNQEAANWFTDFAIKKYLFGHNRVALQMLQFLKILELIR